jgi:replication-associated recombination protein RarA
MKNTLWVENYRSQTLDQYIGNDGLKSTIDNWIKKNDIPHLLLYGKPGTGKTTLAKLIVNNIDCDYLYINASDEN